MLFDIFQQVFTLHSSETSETLESGVTSESLGQTILNVAQSQHEQATRHRSPSPGHSTPKRHNTPPIDIPKSHFIRSLQVSMSLEVRMGCVSKIVKATSAQNNDIVKSIYKVIAWD